MAFYDLPKKEREMLVAEMQGIILAELETQQADKIIAYFGNADTYIRKAAYINVGKIYFAEKALQKPVLKLLGHLFKDARYHIRQTVVNAAGEIGKKQFEPVQPFLDTGLFDEHHTVRNAVIGSVKKMGEVNPGPVLEWARKYLHHADKEVRREICHGIELRGRKYPEDILPMLKELEHDKTARVRNTLVHVLGQIAYKKGCLQTVVAHLKTWENKDIVTAALDEIIDVHYRYRNFSYMTQDEARKYIRKEMNLA